MAEIVRDATTLDGTTKDTSDSIDFILDGGGDDPDANMAGDTANNEIVISQDDADTSGEYQLQVRLRQTDSDPAESQDGNDLPIVNNGDGSDFLEGPCGDGADLTSTPDDGARDTTTYPGFEGGVYVATADINGDETVPIEDMTIL